jgi:hypothetical protein
LDASSIVTVFVDFSWIAGDGPISAKNAFQTFLFGLVPSYFRTFSFPSGKK